MRIIPKSFLLLLPFLVTATLPLKADEVDFRDFDGYQQTLSKAQIQHTLSQFLQKSPQILEHLQISDEALSLYASPQDKERHNAEYTLNFGNKPRPASLEKKPRNVSREQPLAGLRIALDPGHIGGQYAQLEERFIDMKPGPEVGNQPIQFNEGTLTVATAKYLKRLLESAGATVMLTRSEPGQFVSAVGFPEWRRSKEFERAVEEKVASIDDKKREAARNWWLKEAPESTIFRLLYNNEDLRARAKLINEFKPDLTFDIHYNAGAGNDKTTGQNLGTADNYNMAFVPGSFMKGELADKVARYEFLRLLVTDDLEHSIALSAELIKQFEKRLSVRAVRSDEKSAPYLKSACLPAGPEGVYCRNLGITRLIHSPIAYGESLCQDNFEECRRLAENSVEIDGIKTSPRVKLVAEAYFQATLAVYGKLKD